MNDPDRLLLDSGAGSLERALLDAWNEDRPTREARAKTLAALGLASGVVTGAAATASVAPKAMVAGSAALLKWIGLAVFVLGIAAVVVAKTRSDSDAKIPAPIAPTVTVTPPHVEVAPSPTPSSSTVLDLDSNPSTPAPALTGPSHASPHVSRAADPDISPQLALIDGARAALASGDAARANALASRYESQFPNGAFSQEAEVLRIEAMLAQGDRDGATRAGTRFLQSHPSSPHAAHVRELLSL